MSDQVVHPLFNYPPGASGRGMCIGSVTHSAIFAAILSRNSQTSQRELFVYCMYVGFYSHSEPGKESVTKNFLHGGGLRTLFRIRLSISATQTQMLPPMKIWPHGMNFWPGPTRWVKKHPSFHFWSTTLTCFRLPVAYLRKSVISPCSSPISMCRLSANIPPTALANKSARHKFYWIELRPTICSVQITLVRWQVNLQRLAGA